MSCCKTGAWWRCCGCSSSDDQLPTIHMPHQMSVEELDELLRQVESILQPADHTSNIKQLHMSDEVQKNASQLDTWITKHSAEVIAGVQISRDVLNALGHMHWASAGLTIIAMGLNMMLKLHENREQCVHIMSEALKIWRRVLQPLLDRPNGIPPDFLLESISLIIEGYMYCKTLSQSRKLKRFTCVHSHEKELEVWKKKLDLFWSKATAIISVDMRRQLSRKLSVPLPCASTTVPTRLVGLEERKRDVMIKLNLDNKEVTRVVVLHGMGGVGKSTLADAVYNQVLLSGGWRCTCRIELGEKPSKEHITNLQKQMVEDLTRQNLLMQRDAKAIQDELRKVLMDENKDPSFIYIDNVLQQKDLEDFLPLDSEQITIPKGSRWLVTTRDESVCSEVFGRNQGLEVIKFVVTTMNDRDARKLFCWHALGQEDPSTDVIEVYDNGQDLITKMVTSICGNLPLALRVLGRSLYNMRPPMWRKTYVDIKGRGLPRSLEEQVSSVLKSSYSTLDGNTQTAFLLICVCFVGERFRTAFDVVESLLSRASINRLFELGLLEFDFPEYLLPAFVKMHDLVRTLGYEMAVERKCTPEKMLTCKQDFLDCDESSWSTIKWLRVPRLEDGIEAEFVEQCREIEVLLLGTDINGDIEHIPHNLKVVIAKSSCPLELVEKAKKLVYLEVEEMLGFPVGASTRSLQVLRGGSIPEEAVDLHKNTLCKLACDGMEKLSPYFCQQMGKLQNLVITGFAASTLPEEIGDLASLESLIIRSEVLESLPRSLAKLTQLRCMSLDLERVQEIPSGVLGALKSLEYLHLTIGRATCVPMQEISQLEYLYVNMPCVERLTTQADDDQLQTVPSLRLDKLKVLTLDCEKMCSLEGVQLICPSLQILWLNLGKIQVLPLEIFVASKLHTLILLECGCLEELPSQMAESLSSLENLMVLNCPSLKAIPKGLMRSCMKGLVILSCPAVKELPEDVTEEKVQSMKLLCCKKACLTPAMLSFPHVLPLPDDRLDEGTFRRLQSFMDDITQVLSPNICRYRSFF